MAEAEEEREEREGEIKWEGWREREGHGARIYVICYLLCCSISCYSIS